MFDNYLHVESDCDRRLDEHLGLRGKNLTKKKCFVTLNDKTLDTWAKCIGVICLSFDFWRICIDYMPWLAAVCELWVIALTCNWWINTKRLWIQAILLKCAALNAYYSLSFSFDNVRNGKCKYLRTVYCNFFPVFLSLFYDTLIYHDFRADSKFNK